MTKIENRVLKELLIVGMFTSVAVMQAQDLPHDTLKTIYPDDSMVTEIPSSRDGYMEEGTILTPDGEGRLTSILRKDGVDVVKRQGRDRFKWYPSPKHALWLALVTPGAGQAYNHKCWKLPIFYGGFVSCVYAMTRNNQMYHDYAQAYMDIMDNDPTAQSYNNFLHLGATVIPIDEERCKSIFKQRKDRYRRWCDLSVFTTIVVYALLVIDVYVDASLSNLDISDDLSLHIAPTVISNKSIATPNNLLRSSAMGIGYSLTF